MKCEIKYRPVVKKTEPREREALKLAFITDKEFCPVCETSGKKSRVEERLGFST